MQRALTLRPFRPIYGAIARAWPAPADMIRHASVSLPSEPASSNTPSPARVWVVGAGGLLGRSVQRELGADAWSFARSLPWHDLAQLHDQLRDAVHAFAAQLQAEPGRAWSVAWCAGAGIVGTSARELEPESRAFQRLLELLSENRTLNARLGAVSLASSAGGIYGGCKADAISELTPPEPISAYGRAKLEQEQMLDTWLTGQAKVRGLIARFSNLYGPAQRLEKAQGLISHISRCVIHGAPVHLYVPLDTVRDYLFADDAGRGLADGLRRILPGTADQPQSITKVYASEAEVSIAELLAIFRQITCQPVQVVSAAHPTAALQPPRLRFRSQVWPEPEDRVSLIDGVARVYREQRELFARGALPPLSVQTAARER